MTQTDAHKADDSRRISSQYTVTYETNKNVKSSLTNAQTKQTGMNQADVCKCLRRASKNPKSYLKLLYNPSVYFNKFKSYSEMTIHLSNFKVRRHIVRTP